MHDDTSLFAKAGEDEFVNASFVGDESKLFIGNLGSYAAEILREDDVWLERT